MTAVDVLSEPVLEGTGPVVFSTCTTLVSPPIFDVNGYYAALGVSPRATKRQLRDAYLRLNGQASARLTHILHQLLDPQIRAEYDRRSFGRPIADDYAVEDFWAIVQRLVSPEKIQQLSQLVTVEKVAGEDTNPPKFLDKDPSDLQAGVTAPMTGYPYSHYQFDSFNARLDYLPQWQRLIIGSCRRLGVETALALGFHHISNHTWILATVEDHQVLFFHEKLTPHPRHTDNAATSLRQGSQLTTPKERRNHS